MYITLKVKKMNNTPVYRYNAAIPCLEEKPTAEDKFHMEGNDPNNFKDYIASLRSIPTLHKDWPKKDLVEDVDFCLLLNEGKWEDELMFIKTPEYIAVPIPPSQTKEESDEEEMLWNQLMDVLRFGAGTEQDKRAFLKSRIKLSKRI
jgi:hypothetical protein